MKWQRSHREGKEKDQENNLGERLEQNYPCSKLSNLRGFSSAGLREVLEAAASVRPLRAAGFSAGRSYLIIVRKARVAGTRTAN